MIVFMASLDKWKHRSDRRLEVGSNIRNNQRRGVYGSVNSKRAQPPPPPGYLSGICHFVLEKLQMPHGGAGRSYKTPIWNSVPFKIRSAA